jgi:ABC-type bacteriocin/lantibiotic exporter with double-glycine peptidase domain
MKKLSYENSPSLAWLLIKLHWRILIQCCLFNLSLDLVNASGPLILKLLLEYIEKPGQTSDFGLFLVFVLFGKSLYDGFVENHQKHQIFVVGIQIRTALINLIYKKVKI